MDSIKVNKISKENIHKEESPARNASDEDFGGMQVEDLNYFISMLGCSPVKLHGVAKRNTINKSWKKKGCTGNSSCTSKVAKVLKLPSTSLSQVLNDVSKQTCEGCDDLSTLMDEVKQKCATSSKQEVLKLLTLLPKRWTLQRTAGECGVSKYMVNKVHALKKEQGILAEQEESGKNTF
jgi:hypothetical protein